MSENIMERRESSPPSAGSAFALVETLHQVDRDVLAHGPRHRLGALEPARDVVDLADTASPGARREVEGAHHRRGLRHLAEPAANDAQRDRSDGEHERERAAGEKQEHVLEAHEILV